MLISTKLSVEKINNILKNSFVYGLTSSLQSLLGFIMLPILTTYFTPDIFGVYSILLLISSLSSAIFYLGATSSLGRFYYDDLSELYKKKIITTSILITTIGAIILVFLGFIFSEMISYELFQTEAYSLPIRMILIGTAFSFLLNIMTLILRYENRALAFFCSILFVVITNFITTYILLRKFNYGILAPIYGLIFSNAFCFIFLFIKKINFLTKNLEFIHFKLILNFGIQSSVAGLFYYLLDWVDRIIIKDLLDLSQVGIYSLGYRLGSIMNILLIMPFSLVWAPLRLQYSKNEDNSIFSSKIISYYTIAGVIILLISILFGPEFISLIFRNKSYDSAFKIFPIIMFSALCYGYQNIVDFGIYINKKVYYYILVMIAGIIVNILLNYLLIPKYGFVSAAYVTLITYIFTSTSIYLISNRYYIIKIEKKRVFASLITIPFVYFFVFFISDNIFIKSTIFVILAIIFFKWWLKNNERNYLFRLFENIANL